MFLNFFEAFAQSLGQCDIREGNAHETGQRKQVENATSTQEFDRQRERLDHDEHHDVSQSHHKSPQFPLNLGRQQLPDQGPRYDHAAEGGETDIAQNAHQDECNVLWDDFRFGLCGKK